MGPEQRGRVLIVDDGTAAEELPDLLLEPLGIKTLFEPGLKVGTQPYFIGLGNAKGPGLRGDSQGEDEE